MSRIKYLLFIISVSVNLFSGCSGKSIPAPIELTREERLTSHKEMLTFLDELQRKTSNFSIDTIAVSVEGREIVLLHFEGQSEKQEQSSDKIKVLMFAQQHGNEPSGKEASIILARDIATGKFADFLNNIDFYLVPQVNPDGSEKEQRRNANDVDLNRNHLTLSEPEVYGVHEVFHSIMPEVTLDIHEYGYKGTAWVEAGMYKNFGEQMGAVSNPNISMDIRTYSWNTVMPAIKEKLLLKNVGFQRYLVVGDPAKRFRYSTAALNDGRNSFGIYNTLSFLIEGRNGENVSDNIRERLRHQLETMKAFLEFFSENAGEAKSLIREERGKLENSDSRIHLVMDYIKDPANPEVTVGVINAATNEKSNRTFNNFYPLVQPALSVMRPQGYAFPAENTELIEILKRHKISVNATEKSILAAAEVYKITGIKLIENEDKDAIDVSVEVERRRLTIPKGYYIVWCSQMQSNLIASLLEPQSTWGLAHLDDFSSLLKVGSNYPVIRIMRIL